MLEEMIGGLYGIGGVISMANIVLWNVGRLYRAIKCRKVKKCYGQCSCCYNIYCEKYTEIPTQEDIEDLEALLAEMQKGV